MSEDLNPTSYLLILSYTPSPPHHLTNDIGQDEVPANDEGTQLAHSDVDVDVCSTRAWYRAPNSAKQTLDITQDREATRKQMVVAGPALTLANSPVRMYTPAPRVLPTPKATRWRVLR